MLYEKAIKLIKDSPCVYNNRALTYIKLGLFSDAIEDCEKSLELDEFTIRGRLYRAKAYFLSGNASKCRECLDDSRKKMPGHVKMIKGMQYLILFRIVSKRYHLFQKMRIR